MRRGRELVLGVLGFHFQILGHEQPALPNDGIAGPLCKRSVPTRQSTKLVRGSRDIQCCLGHKGGART